MATVSTVKVLAYVHTYNSADVIDATVAALCRQTWPVAEVLLVDNASSDGAADMVAREFPSVKLVRNVVNVAALPPFVLGHPFQIG